VWTEGTGVVVVFSQGKPHLAIFFSPRNCETALSEEFMALKLQRNDTVEVITGTDKGKRGRVLRVLADTDRVLVEHVRMVKKHVHPNPQRNIKGGIAEQEAAIQISNVMLVCGSCGPVRVGHKFEGDTKVRVCKKCGQTLAPKKK
jgi:large subunit ribosomal protein L24